MSLFHAARAMCCDHTGKSLRKNNWACICTHRVSTHALPEQVLSQVRAGLFWSDTSHATGHQSTRDARHVLCRASNGYSQVFRASQRLQQMLYAQQINSPSTRAQKMKGRDLHPSISASKKQGIICPRLSNMISSEGARNKLDQKYARRRATCDIGVCSVPESFHSQKLENTGAKNKNIYINIQIKTNIRKNIENTSQSGQETSQSY